MKLITLHQPWASLVALGLKKYETRHWGTDYRGPVLIHAAKRPFMSADGLRPLNSVAWNVWLRALEIAHETGVITDQCKLPLAYQLPLGCVVAIADITDCRIMAPDMEPPRNLAVYRETMISIADQSELEKAVGLWEQGRYALQLDNVRPIHQPIPFTSRQGKLLDAPPEIAQAAIHQTTPNCVLGEVCPCSG